jgi:DNA-binding XRE family transcriptional regulator
MINVLSLIPFKRQYIVLMRSRALDHIAKPVADDLVRIGALIRDARATRGFTQSELARRLRVSPTTVRAAEQGDPAVAIGILASLLWLLGVGPISASLVSSHPPHVKPKQRVRGRKHIDDF